LIENIESVFRSGDLRELLRGGTAEFLSSNLIQKLNYLLENLIDGQIWVRNNFISKLFGMGDDFFGGFGEMDTAGKINFAQKQIFTRKRFVRK